MTHKLSPKFIVYCKNLCPALPALNLMCLCRPKKMKYQSEENEDKVLPDTMMEDDETIFKKPKIPRVSP